jgi:hypothetical protein
MSTYSGKMDASGPKRGRRNKGIARMMRNVRRSEAETRDEFTHPERKRSFARQHGFSRNSERLANQELFPALPPIVRPNDIDTFYGATDDEAFAIEFWDAKD